MNKSLFTAAATALIGTLCASAADIQLPPPVKTGGATLTAALSQRRTYRDFSAEELTFQELSSLLWAANGINSADGRRTAPTGRNVQDIDIYVVLARGIYLYDAAGQSLKQIRSGDCREAAAMQDFAKTAPVNLVYVQNLDKAMKADEKNTARHGGLHAGAIMQNVYLFCAANKLISVARDMIDREKLAPVLNLSDRQVIMLAQTVGKKAGL